METLQTSLWATTRQVLTVLGPLAVLALLLGTVERMLSARLISRFGWRGVLVTGWLGVPIHELSHVAACFVFRHRVEKVRLFAPDKRSGRLGSVQHAWRRHNVYQQAGRFFIGVAPLVGGSLALWGLARLMSPVPLAPPDLPPDADVFAIISAGAGRAGELLTAMVDPDVLKSPWTWVWLYLCLCIGSHLAPSASDLKGGAPGFVLLMVVLFVVNLVAVGLDADSAAAERAALTASAAMMALMVLALVLGAVCLVIVTLVTAPLPERQPTAG